MQFDPDEFLIDETLQVPTNEMPTAVQPETAVTGPVAPVAPSVPSDEYITPYSERELTEDEINTLLAQGAASGAATAYGFSNDYITPKRAADITVKPLMRGAGKVFQEYISKPFTAGRAVPGVAAAKTISEAIPAMQQEMDKLASTSTPVYNEKAGKDLPKSIDPYKELRNKMPGGQNNNLRQAMTDAYAKGGNAAVSRLFETDKRFKFALDPTKQKTPKDISRASERIELLKKYNEAFPQTPWQRLQRGIGLTARTAGRIAGPVGIGMTAYDLYNHGPQVYEYLKTQLTGKSPETQYTPGTYAEIEQQVREEAARRALSQ